jgi:hypothetical protein
MEHQKPDLARVEDDFVQPLKPMRTRSSRRLASALPVAVVAMLVVGTAAFGATVIAPIIVPDESPIVVGDEPTAEPTAEPTVEPSEEPTEAPAEPTKKPTAEPTAAPTPVELALAVGLDGTKVVLEWTAFEGDDFCYYKLVRSADEDPSWPTGEGDKLVAAIGHREKLTFTDAAPAGKTWHYRVYVVNCTEHGYLVLAASSVATITTPKTPTPPPENPYNLGPITAKKNANGTYTLTWAAYKGSIDFSYYKLSGTTKSGAFGYCEGTGYWAVIEPGQHSWTGYIEPGSWRIKVEAVYYPHEECAKAAETKVLEMTVAGEPTPPPQEMTLEAGAVGEEGVVHLSWSKYTGEAFREYRILKNGTTILEIENVNTLSAEVALPEPGEYHFQLKVKNTGGVIVGISNVATVFWESTPV